MEEAQTSTMPLEDSFERLKKLVRRRKTVSKRSKPVAKKHGLRVSVGETSNLFGTFSETSFRDCENSTKTTL